MAFFFSRLVEKEKAKDFSSFLSVSTCNFQKTCYIKYSYRKDDRNLLISDFFRFSSTTTKQEVKMIHYCNEAEYKSHKAVVEAL